MSERLQAKASVYIGDDDVCWVVSETPSEVLAEIEEAEKSGPLEFVCLTLANSSDWNGKPLYIRASKITSISPPRNTENE